MSTVRGEPHLGEKISWQHGNPTRDRLDLFGAAGVSGGGLDVWSFDAEFLGVRREPG